MSPSRRAPCSSLSDTWMAKNRTFATVLTDPENTDEVSISWRSTSSSELLDDLGGGAELREHQHRQQRVMGRECRVPLHHDLRRRWDRASSIATGRDVPDVGADYGTYYCSQDAIHHIKNRDERIQHHGGDGKEQGDESEVDRVLARWYHDIVSRHCCDGGRGGRRGGGGREKGVVGEGKGNGRHYHTLVHLEEMFGYIDLLTGGGHGGGGAGDVGDGDDTSSWSSSSSSSSSSESGAGAGNKDASDGDELHDLAVVTFATFFHDAVYDPRSTTNEVDSAELYMTFYEEVAAAIERDIENEAESSSSSEGRGHQPQTGSGSNADIKRSWTERFDHDRVMRFVIETARHDVSTSPDVTLRRFVDADMSVLAKEPGAYDVYAGLIRREYVHVDREVYCAKRAEVLTSFLQNGRPIFACEAMREAGLEERARKNVEREVRLLKEGVIPGECD